MKTELEINTFLSEISSVIKACESVLSKSITFEEEIEEKINTISSNEKLIINNKKSISLENKLKNYPCQAIGSVFLYNELNRKANQFDNIQLKGITRFIILIENTEKVYRDQYCIVTKTYLTDPFSSAINELDKTYLTVSNYYVLLKTLINESNGDMVLFNKVYTSLEDSGLFMSVPEKQQLNYLKEMVELHKKLIIKLDKVDLKLIQMNDNITEILSMTDSLEFELWDVSSKIDDLSYDIESK